MSKLPPSDGEEIPTTASAKKKLSRSLKRRSNYLAAIELKKKLIREQLLREIDLTKKSLKRGKLQWEETCKQIKLKDLRNVIVEWGTECERLLGKKDEKIDLLMKTFNETQELHERSYSSHLDTLEYLKNCHQALRNTATVLFETQASDLIQDFLWGCSSNEEVHDSLKLRTNNVIHSSNVVTKCRLRKNYDHYMNRTFDHVSAEIEKRYILRDQNIAKMKSVQDHLVLFLKLLEGDIVDVHKTSKFLNLMQRQQGAVRESNKLNAIERNCCKKISELKQEWLDVEAEFTRRLHGLKLEQAYFLDVRKIIKNTMKKNQQLTYEKLLSVASESHGVIQKLKEMVKTGELLLNLANCCRKYQTEKEKVLPWPVKESLENDSELMLKMKFDILRLCDISEEELMEHMNLMKNFWSRCSNVRVHNMLLEEEKRKLSEENQKYGDIIRSMRASRDAASILESVQIKPTP